jgi:hypothetical protein
MCGESLVAIILAMIFMMAWMRLIGLKSDIFDTIFLRDEGNVCGVKPVKVVGAEIWELIHNDHELVFDNTPIRFEECPGEAIQSWRLFNMTSINGLRDLIFRERCINIGEIRSWSWDLCPMAGLRASWLSPVAGMSGSGGDVIIVIVVGRWWCGDMWRMDGGGVWCAAAGRDGEFSPWRLLPLVVHRFRASSTWCMRHDMRRRRR